MAVKHFLQEKMRIAKLPVEAWRVALNALPAHMHEEVEAYLKLQLKLRAMAKRVKAARQGGLF